MRNSFIALFCMAIATLGTGCGKLETEADPTVAAPAAGTGSEYLASTEPMDATPVGKARETTRDGEEATLVGIIGGSPEPFVEGLAAFTIVDPAVPYCAPDEGCPTPWDYCCTQDRVQENVATVKVVDESGRPVGEDARQLLGVKELSQVVVSGTVQRDDQGNLTLAANKVFVKSL